MLYSWLGLIQMLWKYFLRCPCLRQNTVQVLRFLFKDLVPGESLWCQSRNVYLWFFMNKTFCIVTRCFELYLTHIHRQVSVKQCFLDPSQMKNTTESLPQWGLGTDMAAEDCHLFRGWTLFLLQPAKDVVYLWRCNRIVTKLNIVSVTGVLNHCFRGARRIIFKNFYDLKDWLRMMFQDKGLECSRDWNIYLCCFYKKF